jgi:hypothetical protein
VAVKYVKKRIEVEAEQWFPGREVEGVDEFYDPNPSDHDAPYPIVRTPNGPVRIEPGEWIITGAAGEKYPCKAHIFEQTYEPASAPASEVSFSVDPGEPFYSVVRYNKATGTIVGMREATPEEVASIKEKELRHSLRLGELSQARFVAESKLQLACDVVSAMVEGSPKVVPRELPRWLASFLATSRQIDAERGAVIRALTRELQVAREKLGEEVTVVMTSGAQASTALFADVTVEELKVDPKESVEQLDAHATAKYGGSEPGQAVSMCSMTFYGLPCTLREGHEGPCEPAEGRP